MKIVFNLHNVGLGNNGGSRTLIKCAETLHDLGYEVILSSNINNGYTWHKIKGAKVLKTRNPPAADLAIATGYHSVDSVINQKAKHKVYYIRGYELWQANEDKLLDSFRKLPCIVNSEWLYSHLSCKGISSNIVYPGLDFDVFSDKGPKDNVLGGLFSKRHKTKRHIDVEAAARQSGYICKLVNRDIKNASPRDLAKFYNQCKVWMSPSESEGLHNCPMEAALCGCALVVTDHARSGTKDFVVHGQTALVYEQRDIRQAVEHIRELMTNDDLRNTLVANMDRVLKAKIGNRRDNMAKFVEVAML